MAFAIRLTTFASLTIPLPRRRLDGCACYSPLAHFHVHHTRSSIREIHVGLFGALLNLFGGCEACCRSLLHKAHMFRLTPHWRCWLWNFKQPFTTITHLASKKLAAPSSTPVKLVASSSANESTTPVQFLFRKSEAARSAQEAEDGRRQVKSSKQWTNKLASLAENPSANMQSPPHGSMDLESQSERQRPTTYHVSLRLEGPYFTPADPAKHSVVVCLVAGTGVSGAIAIAAAFSAQSCSPDPHLNATWQRCVVVWSVRDCDYIELPFFQDTSGLEINIHLTGEGRPRLDAKEAIIDSSSSESAGSTWVYICGPNPFIEAGERACQDLSVPYFGARWSWDKTRLRDYVTYCINTF